MMKGFLKKKPADLTTGESFWFTLLMMLGVYVPLMLCLGVIIWWENIAEFFSNLRKKIFKN